MLDWSAPAIAFYEKLGATVLRDHPAVRIEGDALAALARQGENEGQSERQS